MSRPPKEMGTHLVTHRKAVVLTNESYTQIREIKEQFEEELGIKLSINQTVTMILKYYVSNNRNK